MITVLAILVSILIDWIVWLKADKPYAMEHDASDYRPDSTKERPTISAGRKPYRNRTWAKLRMILSCFSDAVSNSNVMQC